MISGESLGGWVATHLAVHRPTTVEKLVLNTAGGWKAHPQVMERLKKLSNEAASDPFWERTKARLEFLMCDKSMVSDDLIETRRAIYAQPGFADTMKRIMCLQEMEVRRIGLNRLVLSLRAHRRRSYSGFSPSASSCRLHSVGGSRSRSMPMPRGRRPSTAALTRLGARKASEMVILTCRTLHFSRAQSSATVVTRPETTSSSHRRPLAIESVAVPKLNDYSRPNSKRISRMTMTRPSPPPP
jgi:pimeloyl-ACP methyl ester carboxylesterase